MNHDSNSINDTIASGRFQRKKAQRIIEDSETARSLHRKLYHQVNLVLSKRNIDDKFGCFFYYS